MPLIDSQFGNAGVIVGRVWVLCLNPKGTPVAGQLPWSTPRQLPPYPYDAWAHNPVRHRVVRSPPADNARFYLADRPRVPYSAVHRLRS